MDSPLIITLRTEGDHFQDDHVIVHTNNNTYFGRLKAAFVSQIGSADKRRLEVTLGIDLTPNDETLPWWVVRVPGGHCILQAESRTEARMIWVCEYEEDESDTRNMWIEGPYAEAPKVIEGD